MAGSTVSYEDIPLVGKWVDYTGSDNGPPQPAPISFEGIANKLDGTRAWEIEHIKLDDKTDRGNNRSVTRTRAHVENIRIQ